MQSIKSLAVLFKFLNGFVHISHFLASKSSFFSDHETLAGFYEKYEEIFDSLCERLIGESAVDYEIFDFYQAAAQILMYNKKQYSSNEEFMGVILSYEKTICELIDSTITQTNDLSQGTINLLAGIADESLVRIYKLQQRLK